VEIVEKITSIIEPSLSALGYHIVLIKLSDGARRKTLTVMAERTDDKMMGFDDCTEISRTISALMDVDDPIAGAYDLEVCSPGLDRPLTSLADYVKYAGHEAKCECFVPIDGRKRFRGIIKGAAGNDVTFEMPEGEATLAFDNIRTAKLIVTDALIASAMKKEKEASTAQKPKAQPKKKKA
jgi:ribosome maturation factor RimP